MRKPVKGETLWVLPIKHNVGDVTAQPQPVMVTQVGSKYFTAGAARYHIDTWREVAIGSIHTALYENKQQIENEKEHKEIADMLFAALERRERAKITLTTLRAMRDVLIGRHA